MTYQFVAARVGLGLALVLGVELPAVAEAQQSGRSVQVATATLPPGLFHGDEAYFRNRVKAEWTSYFSDSGDRTTASCDRGVVNALRCHPDKWYCSDMTISCDSDVPVGPMASDWGLAFSEEGQNTHSCRPGEFVAGIKCSGPYCDNLQVKCRPVHLPMMTRRDAEATGVDFNKLGYTVTDTSVCKTYEGLANAADGRSAMREHPDAYIQSISCRGNYCMLKDLRLCLVRKHPGIDTHIQVDSNWTELKSCIGCPKISESATVGLQTKSSESNTLGWAASVTATFKVTAGGDALGGSLESGLSASFGANGAKTLIKTVQGASSKTTASDCAPSAGETGVTHLALWQYGFKIGKVGCSDGDCTVDFGTDELLCIKSQVGNVLKPKCAPEACQDVACQVCN